MNEIDHGKVIADVATNLTKEYFDRLFASGKDLFIKKVKSHFMGFEDYLERTYLKCSQLRMLVNRDQVINLQDVYVSGSFMCGDTTFTDQEIERCIRENGRAVVQGFGGIGKTVLLRKLWLSIFSNPAGKLPIYVELKNLNDITTLNLMLFIKHSVKGHDQELSDDVFVELLRSGRFVLMFDGFDELNSTVREEIQREILNLSHSFPKLGIVVTSRLDDRFFSWERYQIFKSLPYTKEQNKELLAKILFDTNVKKRFVSEILDKNYEKYEAFFSTPLLTLMMLMVYRQFSEIPDKLNIFYKHAFSTLYLEHDASKENFRRERRTGLDEDSFLKVVSVFSMYTYSQMRSEFSREVFRESLEKAIEISQIEVDVDCLIDELVESVNLMFKDGQTFAFIHRSFQEYFCANAIVSYFPPKLNELIGKLPLFWHDNMLKMAYEMKPEVLEDMYILPFYRANKSKLEHLMRPDVGTIEKFRLLNSQIIIPINKRRKIPSNGMSVYCESDCLTFARAICCCFPQQFFDEVLSVARTAKKEPKWLREVLQNLAYPELPENEFTMLYSVTLNENAVEFPANATLTISEELLTDIVSKASGRAYIDQYLQMAIAQITFSVRISKQILTTSKKRNTSIDEIFEL